MYVAQIEKSEKTSDFWLYKYNWLGKVNSEYWLNTIFLFFFS